MIKLLVKLAIAALVANAVYRVGSEYLTYIRFRDGVRAAATYRARTDVDLRRRIVALASDYDIPLGSDDIVITRESSRVAVDLKYRKTIEVLPQYLVEWPFNLSMDVTMTPMTLLPGAPEPK